MESYFVIGTGKLSWMPGERRTDRYGTVCLFDPDTNEELHLNRPEGRPVGVLTATILATRTSHHIGDLFRGFYPSTPEVGEKIVLGEGKLFYLDPEDGEGIECVGLSPGDRTTDWLNPEALYRCHDQVVKLIFSWEE